MRTISKRKRCFEWSPLGRCVIAVSAIVAGLLLAPAAASAEGGKPLLYCQEKPKVAAKAKKVAGDLFGRAERAFNNKQYPKALKRFLCSLHIIEHEATVTNIEKVVETLENKDLALRLLGDYVSLNPEGEFTPDMKELIAELELALGRNQPEPEVKCEPPKPPSPVCVTVPDAAPYIAYAESFDKTDKIFSFGAIGAGAATIIAGGVLQGLSLAARNRADEADSYDTFLDEVRKKKAFQTGAIVGFAAGTVTAGIGVAQLVIMKRRQKRWNRLREEDPSLTECSPKEEKPEANVTVGLRSVNFSVRF